MAKSEYPVGLLGHSLRPGSPVLVEWQFKVMAETKDGRYALQLFSWLSGDPTNIVFVNDADLTDVTKYKLYDSEQKWRDAAERSAEYDRRQHAEA